MTFLTMSLLVWAASLLAGFLGALTGLGGGVVVVPLLAVLFHVDLRYAVGASLLSVIATAGRIAGYVITLQPLLDQFWSELDGPA